jgi:hypothetical protein
MPGCPLRNACVRPAWFNGASRSKSKATAGQMPASMWLSHCYREQARSHIGSLADTKSMCTAKPVGASLLAMRPAHPTSSSAVKPPSRARSLPHWIFGRYKIHVHRKTCGSELAREGASKPNIHVTEPPLSRASFAPTDLMGVRPQEPGRLLGRLAVDVDLGAPLTTMAERRHCGVGIGWPFAAGPRSNAGVRAHRA